MHRPRNASGSMYVGQRKGNSTCHRAHPLSVFAANDAARPRRHDGAALAGIAAGLGRRQRRRTARRSRRCAGLPVLRQRLPQPGVVGQGRRQPRWSWAKCSSRCMPFREKLLFIRGLYNAEALNGGIHSCQTGNLLTGAHLASGGEIRSGIEHGSGRRPAADRPDQGAEPGAGLRAVDRGAAQELLDDLQLAHLVELADHADAAGAVSGPGLRPPVPRRGRPGRQERAGRRAGRRRPACATQISTPTSAGWTNICRRSAKSSSGSTRPARTAGCKAGGRRWPSRTCRARPTAFRRTSTSTCG